MISLSFPQPWEMGQMNLEQNSVELSLKLDQLFFPDQTVSLLPRHFKQLAPESWMLKPWDQSGVLAHRSLTMVVRLPVTPSSGGKIVYTSDNGKELSILLPHLHNSGKSTKHQVKQHSGVKQTMIHSWRQRSFNSIQLHQFNWVLKTTTTKVPQ